MDIDFRLRQIAGKDQAENPTERVGLLRAQLETEVAADVPLGKEIEFPPQQGLVVGRQHAFSAGKLPADQRVDRVAEKRVRIPGVERCEVSRGAQVRQQQKSARKVLCQHRGHVNVRIGHQCGDSNEGTAVFLRRRRIHRDQRGIRKSDAKVAAEAGVGGSRREGERLSGKLASDPILKRSVAVQSASLP